MMYKKITHNIVEEHFQNLAVIPASVKVTGGAPPGWLDCDLVPPGPNCPSWMIQTPSNKTSVNQEDAIKLNVPLMIRLLEWAREDANKDVELHVIAEQLINLSKTGDTLTMGNYADIVGAEIEVEKGK